MTKDFMQEAERDGIQKLIVGAYILRDKKLLLLRRSANENFLPGLVELPSGGVEDGETLDHALTREVEEETGLYVISVDHCVNSFDYISASGKSARQYNFVVTVANAESVKLNAQEHDAYYWVSPDAETLKLYQLSEQTRQIILDAAEQAMAVS